MAIFRDPVNGGYGDVMRDASSEWPTAARETYMATVGDKLLHIRRFSMRACKSISDLTNGILHLRGVQLCFLRDSLNQMLQGDETTAYPE